MNQGRYIVYSYDGAENCRTVAAFNTLEEAQADRDARNRAEASRRVGSVDDLYYEVEDASPEPADPWSYLNLGYGTDHGFGEEWKLEADEREKVGSILRVHIVHRNDKPDVFLVTSSIIHEGDEEYDQSLYHVSFPSLREAKEAGERWLTRNPQSVTCLDLGFDLRLDKRSILLPADGVAYYRYETREGEIKHIRAQSRTVGDVLKSNGYRVKFAKKDKDGA